MSVLSDREITERCTNTETPMISPFVGHQVKELDSRKLISYGLSCYGFDIRVADEFKVIKRFDQVIDPKNKDCVSFSNIGGAVVEIPPNSMMLCRSVEYFRIPRDIMCIAVGKSTYARVGVIANITPLEPEWEGYLTIELSNTTPLPVKVYANEGIAQLIFFKADNICQTSYKDKDGKYQGQTGVTGSIV